MPLEPGMLTSDKMRSMAVVCKSSFAASTFSAMCVLNWCRDKYSANICRTNGSSSTMSSVYDGSEDFNFEPSAFMEDLFDSANGNSIVIVDPVGALMIEIVPCARSTTD